MLLSSRRPETTEAVDILIIKPVSLVIGLSKLSKVSKNRISPVEAQKLHHVGFGFSVGLGMCCTIIKMSSSEGQHERLRDITYRWSPGRLPRDVINNRWKNAAGKLDIHTPGRKVAQTSPPLSRRIPHPKCLFLSCLVTVHLWAQVPVAFAIVSHDESCHETTTYTTDHRRDTAWPQIQQYPTMANVDRAALEPNHWGWSDLFSRDLTGSQQPCETS